MHGLIPLLLILILFNSKQLRDDKLYRANIFALTGISYFFLLQYTAYWYRVFPTESLMQYVPGLIAVLSTIGIALSPWNKHSHPVKTLILCGLFAVILTATLTLDKPIKEKLAETGGFFADDELVSRGGTIQFKSKSVEIPTIGIRLDTPLDWQQHQLPSGHIYFIQNAEEKTLMEIRPNCLDELMIDTPTYLFNILDLFEAKTSNAIYDYKCMQTGKSKTCYVRVSYPPSNTIKEKWHWLKIPEDRSRSIAIDFLIQDTTESQNAEIWEALESIQFMEAGASEPCHTPAAWL